MSKELCEQTWSDIQNIVLNLYVDYSNRMEAYSHFDNMSDVLQSQYIKEFTTFKVLDTLISKFSVVDECINFVETDKDEE